MKSVYLAGPITGCSYDGATDWRDSAQDLLTSIGIESFSPMRGKTYLLNESNIKDKYDEYYLSTIDAIMCRDYFDCERADALLVNLLGATKVSIGTCMEIAWAYSKHKPVVCIIEPEGNIHSHGMLMKACPWKVNSLDEAILALRNVLLP